MKMLFRLLLVGVIVSTLVNSPAHAQEWLTVQDVNMEVESGSAIDFSSIAGDAPAGKHGWAIVTPDGHIGFEKLPRAQRFLSASFAFSRTSGGMPDREQATRIATQLRRAGYGAVRLHFLDAHLMTGRDKDFDFDPEQFDRFQFFLNQLKIAGLYWVIDVLDSDNGAYGGVTPHRWVNKFQFRLGFYTEPEKQAHWARMLQDMLGRMNPYTNTVPLQDPALLGLILINEGGVAELSTRNGGRFSARFAPLFRQWLKSRYGSSQELARVWGKDLKEGETLESIVEVPAQLRSQDARGKDFMRFVSELEVDKLQWMTARARALGFKGLLTAYNNWGFFQSDITRASAEWVDMHSYHVLPSDFVSPGSKVAQTSAISNSARYVRELTNSRQWGKPFTVSEYGQPFWNAWRRESIAMVPAYASLHGWDLITNFAENSFQLDLRSSSFARKNAIHPFGISNDPILSTGEKLAALLFKRADVRTSGVRIYLPLDASAAFAENGGWGQLNENVSRLALVAATGLDVDIGATANRGSVAGKADFVLPIDSSSTSFTGRLGSIVARLGAPNLTSYKDDLIRVGALPTSNQTDFSRQFYQSDTGELTLDVINKQFLVATQFTELISMDRGTAQAGGLTVSNPSVPVLVAAASLDGKPVALSKHLLIFVLSDAQNTGMEFRDAARTELKTLGQLPAMLQRVQLKLTLKSTVTTNSQLFSLSFAGKRRDLIPHTVNAGRVHLELDTAALKQGPSTMFELVYD